MAEGQGAVLLGVVERNPLFQVCASLGKLSEGPQEQPQRQVSLQEGHWVLQALGQAEELFPEFTRPLVLGARKIKPTQSLQHRDKLRGVSHLLA